MEHKYYDTVRGIKLYNNGGVSKSVMKKYAKELENAHEALVNTDTLRVIQIVNSENLISGRRTLGGFAHVPPTGASSITIIGAWYYEACLTHELMHVWDICTMSNMSRRNETVIRSLMQELDGMRYADAQYSRTGVDEFLAECAEEYFFNHD